MQIQQQEIRDFEVCVFLGDIHFPHSDPWALQLALQGCRYLNPDRIYLIGDVTDFHAISKYNKRPPEALTLQKEINESRTFLRELRNEFPGAEIHYLDGNHEQRLTHYLWRNPEIFHLEVLSIQSLLHLNRLNIHHHPYNQQVLIGDSFIVEHGNIVRKHSGYTASGMVENRHISGISGHTHRLGTHFRCQWDQVLRWHENGCLCQLNPGYATLPNWQQGFSVGLFHPNLDLVAIEQIPIYNQSRTGDFNHQYILMGDQKISVTP